MKKLILTLVLAAALLGVSWTGSASAAPEQLYDSCPNLDWAISPLDAFEQTGDPYELKWSNRYNAYICVEQHN